MNQMLNTFLPILLLWALGYSTLFIGTRNFSDRFMGTVTALLVLVSLLSSVNEDLPKTSYMKLIDLWFLWHITSLLVIIIFHIILDRMRKRLKPPGYNGVQAVEASEAEIPSNNEVTQKIVKITQNSAQWFLGSQLTFHFQ